MSNQQTNAPTLSNEQIEAKLLEARLHLTNLFHEISMEITRKSLGQTSCPFSDCIELLDLIDDLTKYEQGRHWKVNK